MNEKSGLLQFFMSDKTSYYQENRAEILNCVKKYYEDKKKWRQKARNKYREFEKEEYIKKRVRKK